LESGARRPLRDQPAKSHLRAVDVADVPIPIDERVGRIFGRVAFAEFAIPAELSRVGSHPDVDGQAPECAEAALEPALIS
jgi:hypothetical protein